MNNLPLPKKLTDDYVCDYSKIEYDNIEINKYYIVEVINNFNDEDENKYFVIKVISKNSDYLITQSNYIYSSYDEWIRDIGIGRISTKDREFIEAKTNFYKFVLKDSI
jgi:hypothetical protein